MKGLEDIQRLIAQPVTDGSAGTIYFIGVGGIGMSALARYFKSRGFAVAGYDKTPTVLTARLEQEGIVIHFEEQVSAIPADVRLVVYTPAVPKQHKELVYLQEKQYPVLKRSEVLGLISNSSFNICIAGTHGKTTTTSMVAHILRHSGYGCNAFLGGIAANYNTNFWSHERNVSVIEADEYDRSFLRLSPDIAIISSMDADHLDIYGTEAALQDAFIQFSEKVKPGGLLISKYGLAKTSSLKASRHITYSAADTKAVVHAHNIRLQEGGYCFDVQLEDAVMENVVLNMGGRHNIENITAAIAVAHALQIDAASIKAAVAAYAGVKRRFEYIVPPAAGHVVFVDDYAHHPEELRALLTGAKGLFAERKCTIVFQPHLFSRTNDFATGFAAVLDQADEIILLPIYPARELPMPGVSSQLVTDLMQNKNVRIVEKENLVNYLAQHWLPAVTDPKKQLLITAGAGDIDTLVQPIKKLLNQ